jgi:hypothetical protein
MKKETRSAAITRKGDASVRMCSRISTTIVLVIEILQIYDLREA